MKAILISVIAVSLFILATVFYSSSSNFALGSDSDVVVFDRKAGITLPRVISPIDVSVADLPDIAAEMSRSTASVRYATLAFCPLDCISEDDSLNVQLSMENGEIGFDWVLLGPRNILDKRGFIAFARSNGFEPVERRMNGVSYLRVNSTEAVKLASLIVTEMYELPSPRALTLYHEGFDWPQP